MLHEGRQGGCLGLAGKEKRLMNLARGHSVYLQHHRPHQRSLQDSPAYYCDLYEIFHGHWTSFEHVVTKARGES